MGTSLCSSLAQRIFYFDYGFHQSHFCFVESSFYFIRVIFVLLSPIWFRVIVYSSCWESSLFVLLYRFTHDILIGSFSDMILLFWVCVILFLMSMLYISCLDVCYAFDMRHLFHLYIMITLTWPIMKDIEPIDLGLGDRPREFETMSHFTFWSEYHIHIHILTL